MEMSLNPNFFNFYYPDFYQEQTFEVIGYSDFLSNAALFFAFAKLENPQVDRDDAIHKFAMLKYYRLSDDSMAIANRMLAKPERAAFILDQYFYSLFGRTPHFESGEVLPQIVEAYKTSGHAVLNF